MEFFDFVEAPKNVSDEVIKKVKGEFRVLTCLNLNLFLSSFALP
jgi:hypothetical protein